ncbi:hypothetical protein ILUMI_09288 [Ignelater luminosus]|uniref:HTH psq-type domain-containing protein n=1 Tax=Ignelater luminosus TaxID=2038154 RepID=A0A8K0D017_IGNLU|nr:hypothetical protein ILUMI_09288 [Ignelater luminosus]
MVRTYIRKIEKGVGHVYSAENLKAAIDDIKHENKSFGGASQFYNIPKTTLTHYVKDTRGVKGRIAADSRGGGGVKAYLPSKVEEEIAIEIELIKLAQENQVTIVKLLPHTTHVLQPLDVAVFRGLKTKWDQQQQKHPQKKIPKDEFIVLLSKDGKEVPSTTVLNHFATTEIYDPEIQGLNKVGIPRWKGTGGTLNEKKLNKEELEKKSAEKKSKKKGNEKEEQQEISSKKLDKKDVSKTAEDISIVSTSKDKTSPQKTKSKEIDGDDSEISDIYSLRESDADPMSFSEEENNYLHA